MQILFDATTFANPATTFGHGIIPATPAWQSSASRKLAQLGYDVATVNASVAWIVSRGKLDGIPIVKRADWSTINAIVANPVPPVESDAEADRQFRCGQTEVSLAYRYSCYQINIEDCREAAEMMATVPSRPVPPSRTRTLPASKAIEPTQADRLAWCLMQDMDARAEANREVIWEDDDSRTEKVWDEHFGFVAR
jgi:hypothetical protein